MATRPAAHGGDRLELLETFVRIADEGGIGAAARALDTTQPTVTRRLQQLEAALDARLVERGPQGVGLTPAGSSLLPEARELAARWRGLESVVHAQSAEVSGLVRVVAARDLGTALLPAILAGFAEEYDGARVDARFTDGLVDLTGDGVDFWLREGKGGPDGSASKEIAKCRWALYASERLARRLEIERGVAIARCEPLALDGAPVVAGPRTGRGLARFHPVGLGPGGGAPLDVRFTPVIAVDALDAAADLGVAGVGLVCLPEWRAAPLVRDGALLRVAGQWAADDTPISLVWNPARFRSPAASALFDLVQAALPDALSGRRAPTVRLSDDAFEEAFDDDDL